MNNFFIYTVLPNKAETKRSQETVSFIKQYKDSQHPDTVEYTYQYYQISHIKVFNETYLLHIYSRL